MAANAPLHPLVEQSRAPLAGYGYGLSEDGCFMKGERTLSVRLEAGRGRLRAVSTNGNLLWSGKDAVDFVRSFWHATKVTP